MCGRAKLDGDVSELKIRFSIPPKYPAPNFAPNYKTANALGLTVPHSILARADEVIE